MSMIQTRNQSALGVTFLDARYLITIDTRVNILKSSPAVVGAAYASDTDEFFVWDGSTWHNSPIEFGWMVWTDDMGALPFTRDWGYRQIDLANKVLHNVRFGDFVAGNIDLRDGAVRQNFDTGLLQVRHEDIWKNIRSLTDAEVSDIVLWSWFTGEVAANLCDVIHGHEIDMGALPSDHIIFRGDIPA